VQNLSYKLIEVELGLKFVKNVIQTIHGLYVVIVVSFLHLFK